ncbi:MAG TPA: dihydroneopterin aldolase, partial [Rhizomicrobium sp.]|nr:dihydroneopterin aldolase [Rhizomicrobium sp.]
MTGQPPRYANAEKALRHVFIRDLELLAHIGIHGHEITKHQPVRINVDLAVEDVVPLEDRLERVVDYEAITLRIRALIAK